MTTSFITEDGKPVNHGAVSFGLGCAHPGAPGEVFSSVFAVMSLVNDILVRYQVKSGTFPSFSRGC